TERGEWDTRCAGEFEATRGGVSVGFTTSNGFADLVLHQTISQTFSRQEGDACVSHDRPTQFAATTLRYDGTSYRSSGP
ncbi:MAG: hypothetical protein KJ901_14385, partial [Gammaproteobacteria bacterium]|nr:hypothetical protein [Gammaproteobacteria bacterium]